MRFQPHYTAALLCCIAVVASDRPAGAQSQSTSLLRSSQSGASAHMSSGATTAPQAPPMSGGMSGSEVSPGYYMSGASEMSGDACGCENYCCEQTGCGTACGSCDSGGWCGLCGPNGGQFFFTADYLNVRASFSEAIAKVEEDLATGTDRFIPLEFNFNSSYRFGGGYRLCCCGEEIRFMYTRMTSDAADTAVNGDLVPIEASPPPGGTTFINASVDAKSYDVEWAKTIPLGGCCDSACCGDPCATGCSGCCRPCCPAWDITWSGGFRWADVHTDRDYDAQDNTGFTVTDGRADMNFTGGGLRTGLEGRRYFGKDGWLSLYGKGNISLLFGNVDIKVLRTVDDSTTPESPDVTNFQAYRHRQIIPVTELEAGGTAQVTSHASITAGYLYAAWHDLGYRDQDQLNTLLPVTYDDANILGFDGFFARVEFAY